MLLKLKGLTNGMQKSFYPIAQILAIFFLTHIKTSAIESLLIPYLAHYMNIMINHPYFISVKKVK